MGIHFCIRVSDPCPCFGSCLYPQFHALWSLFLPRGEQSAGATLQAAVEHRGWGGSRQPSLPLPLLHLLTFPFYIPFKHICSIHLSASHVRHSQKYLKHGMNIGWMGWDGMGWDGMGGWCCLLTWYCGCLPPVSAWFLPEHAVLSDSHREEQGGQYRGPVHQCR